jgi:hypothetical protein
MTLPALWSNHLFENLTVLRELHCLHSNSGGKQVANMIKKLLTSCTSNDGQESQTQHEFKDLSMHHSYPPLEVISQLNPTFDPIKDSERFAARSGPNELFGVT